MTRSDNTIKNVPPKDKILDLTLSYGNSLLDVNLESGIAEMEFEFSIHDEPSTDQLNEVLDFLHSWEQPLWEPTKQFVLKFCALELGDQPMSRLNTQTYMSNVWSCKFSRKLPIPPKVLNRWDSCSVQLQFESLRSDHFSIFISPWYQRNTMVGPQSSATEESEFIDKAFASASAELANLIGAVLLESGTKISLGKTTAPADPTDPDAYYVTRGVVVN